VKNHLEALNKAFESRVRLGIMSLLMVNSAMDFGMLKEQLNITDGNLASHLNALDKLGYILITKQFIGKNQILLMLLLILAGSHSAITSMHWNGSSADQFNNKPSTKGFQSRQHGKNERNRQHDFRDYRKD
jgi:DNA-binding transcriptional ArsR family regulator